MIGVEVMARKQPTSKKAAKATKSGKGKGGYKARMKKKLAARVKKKYAKK